MGHVTEPQNADATSRDGGEDDAAQVVALLPATWTVDIEAGGDPSAPAVDRTALRGLLDVMRDRHPSVGCTAWTYSVRFTVDATEDAGEAIQRAITLWRDAIAEAGLPDWPVKRCEAHRRS